MGFLTQANGATGEPKPERQWIIGEKAFNAKAVHHQGIKELWEKKWKFPCTIGVYPFHDGRYEDFARVFEHLIKENINDGYSDAYTSAFFPVCDDLKSQAATHIANSKPHLASDLYLRIACLYRIARFPYIDSPLKRKAWELQLEVYMKVAGQWTDPVIDAHIPHVYASDTELSTIPIYYRVPSAASKKNRVPTILLITGLDGHRPDNSQRTHDFLKRGWATVIAEIPGTADCPADPKDPKSPDRLWDSIFKWMAEQGVFDLDKVAVWGLSTGGFYAARIAHTHKAKLRGSVAHGMGCHHVYDPQWIERADLHEYPFPFNRAFSQKHGYKDVQEYKDGAQKRFSLLENGILNQPSARLLLINGMSDGLMPIEDSILLLQHGSPKEARFIPNGLHMGYPTANSYVYPWLENVLA